MYVYQQASSVLADLAVLAVLAVRLSDYDLPTGRKVSMLAQVSLSISEYLLASLRR